MMHCKYRNFISEFLVSRDLSSIQINENYIRYKNRGLKCGYVYKYQLTAFIYIYLSSLGDRISEDYELIVRINLNPINYPTRFLNLKWSSSEIDFILLCDKCSCKGIFGFDRIIEFLMAIYRNNYKDVDICLKYSLI